SGFFFCGMIDDPVAYASSISAQPNSCDDHSTISSPSRDRCTPSSAATKQNSAAKSRSLTASIEFSAARAKPSSLATACGSSGSEHLVAEHHRLGVLQVGHPGGGRGLVLFRLGEQCRLQLGQPQHDEPGVIPQVHAQVGGDLVVAAATGPPPG